MQDCKSLDILFKNQNSIHLVNEAFEIYKQTDKVTSTLNSATKDIFFNYRKKPFDHTFNLPRNSDNLRAYDIQKCHSACLSIKNQFPWSIFTIFDEVKPFSGVIVDGFFYIESDNYFPLHGNGWYSRGMLSYAQQQGISFKVIYELIPTTTLRADYFNDFVERVYTKCVNPKKMMNCFIGCLNKKSKSIQRDIFTTSLTDAVRSFFENKNSVYCPLESVELYHILNINKHALHENSIPIYWQVLDNSNIMLHQLAMKMGGRLIKLKTDCVVAENCNEVVCLNGIGSYRLEKIPKEFTLNSKNSGNDGYFFKMAKSFWKSDDSVISRLLCGRAGTGKSFKIKELCKQLKSYVVLASTNKAARLVGGQTVHKYFNVDENGGYRPQQAIRAAQNVDYIVIDEVGMLSSMLYQLLYFIKIHTSVKFILVGDYEQLGPVERTRNDYFNSLVLKELVDSNMIHLTQNMRSDGIMWDLYDKVGVLKPSDFGNQLTRRNLCFTNAKRMEINDFWMNEDKKKKKKMKRINANSDDPNSQDVALMKGTPVMAMKNCLSKGFVNSDTFTCTDVSPLTLQNDQTKQLILLDDHDFINNFYVNYCCTVHKMQGETFNTAFTIHEWERMRKRMRYTAISRATNKNLINIVENKESLGHNIAVEDTNHPKLAKKLKRKRRLQDELFAKRYKAVTVLNKIIREDSVSDEYSRKHTYLSRNELLIHLGISEKVPRGYEIDHIRERCDHFSDDDFRNINAYWNLRLLPAKYNCRRHFEN